MAINTLNLYSASKEQIFQHANYLQLSLAETNTALDNLNPDAQVTYYNSFQKKYDLLTGDLNALRIRVSDTYRGAKNAIPNISQDELKIISNELEVANANLRKFSANEALATKISDLLPKVKAAFADRKNADPEILDIYQKQIVELKSDKNINTGNREAVEKLMRIAESDMYEVSDDAESEAKQKAEELLDKLMDLMNSCDPKDRAKLQQIKDILNEKQMPSSRASQTRSESIGELQNLLSFFTEDANLTDAVQRLEEIEYRGIEFQTILESVYFHLYLIHKIETPTAPLKKDSNYGRKAMIGIYPATNTDRSRAINRTLAEIAVQALKDTVASGQISDTQEVLKTLESLKMSAGDMPEGQNNLAHALFGKMYHKHLEARKTNSSLIDPHHRQFQGDFGRNAFGTIEGVTEKVKIAVIEELHDDLKRAWKLVI